MMLALIESEAYLIDGEQLTFEGTKENGELIIFKKEDGSSLDIPLNELIKKDIQEVK